MKTAKELWESLEKKYKTEDVESKNFLVGKFLEYKMIDSKSVISQVQDLQVLLHDLHAEKMTVSGSFQVASCSSGNRKTPAFMERFQKLPQTQT